MTVLVNSFKLETNKDEILTASCSEGRLVSCFQTLFSTPTPFGKKHTLPPQYCADYQKKTGRAASGVLSNIDHQKKTKYRPNYLKYRPHSTISTKYRPQKFLKKRVFTLFWFLKNYFWFLKNYFGSLKTILVP